MVAGAELGSLEGLLEGAVRTSAGCGPVGKQLGVCQCREVVEALGWSVCHPYAGWARQGCSRRDWCTCRKEASQWAVGSDVGSWRAM